MTSVTQMSFQRKAVALAAAFLRNDCHGGVPSGTLGYSSHPSHHSHASLTSLEHWYSGHCLVISAWASVIPARCNPLIYRLLTLSNLNKKYFLARIDHAKPNLYIGAALLGNWEIGFSLAFGIWSFPLPF
jgi:hypothetical protein